MRYFREAMSKIGPLSEEELHWYKTIAEQFARRQRIRLRNEEIKSGIGGRIS